MNPQSESTPYYAVIFSSQHTNVDQTQYESMAKRMEELASNMPGFIGIESTKNHNGFGITISYWKNLESILLWKNHPEHINAQNMGKEKWYSAYNLRVAKIEYEYSFSNLDS